MIVVISLHNAVGARRWLPGSGLSSYFQKASWSKFRTLPTGISRISSIRGGNNDYPDDERYSRQVYTLGARAHSLVRGATVYLDGPPASGLLYECAKNLALSGVGKIVILTSNDASEKAYHVDKLDDLGKAYGRAARSELGHSMDDGTTDDTVLLEYIRRLNPSVFVTILKRSELESTENGVLLSIDRPQQSQLLLNKLCRQLNLKFVAAETAGVYGRIFCDFGPSFQVFDIDGETPLIIPLDRIEIEGNETIMVHCISGEKHDVSNGDHIHFHLGNGEALTPPCVVNTVYGPFRFSVRLASKVEPINEYVSQVNKQATSFSRFKLPHVVSFLSMEDALAKAEHDGSLFAPCDLDKSFDHARRISLLSCFQALPIYLKANNKYPSRVNEDRFRELGANGDVPFNSIASKSLVEKFTRCCAAKLTPLQGIIGAIGAQEALKAVSGLYNPVKQFLLYDCDELLDESHSLGAEDEASATSGLEYIFGETFCTKLANTNLFIVGAGAIGCELLKNLSAMDAGNKNGRVIITDMDTIEKSNLSRQLLFRDGDIGKFKSKAAEKAVQRFNPSINIQVHTNKVGDEEYGHFNDKFWENEVGVIMNALDNVEARLYMDGQCVVYNKALIDAGTLGSKGNVQVVVPHQSESYGFSADPPDPAIPICTLKNFPYAIAHTIQWGRDLFEGYFERRPKQANEYRTFLTLQEVPIVAKKLINDLGDEAAIQAAEELKQDLKIDFSTMSRAAVRTEAIQWAATEVKRLFSDAVDDLLKEHPADSIGDDGEPFWSGTRRVPIALGYSNNNDGSKVNENILEFVRAAGRLRIGMLSSSLDGQTEVSTEEAIEAILATQCQACEATKSFLERPYDRVAHCLEYTVSCPNPLQVIEFEKDDELNGHVAFITAASNLRALCYGITPVDAMETRRIAGRIIPAMITTTAFVSALACIELLKLVQNAPLERHRNAFINLALPFFAFTAPLPAEEVTGLRGATYTEWDRIVVKETKKAASRGGITLEGLLGKLKKKVLLDDAQDIVISSISFGPYLLYANFLHEADKHILKQPLWMVVKQAVQGGYDDDFAGRDALGSSRCQWDELSRKTFIDLCVVVEDLRNDEEVQLPPVRVKRRTIDLNNAIR